MKLSTWRLVIVCVLLAAVPLRVGAAVAMIACAPNHDANHATANAHHEPETATDGGSAHHHASAHGDRSTSHASAAPADTAQLKCNACAPCCMGVIVSGVVPVRSPSTAARTDFSVSYPVRPSADLIGLDRPPIALVA